MTRISNIPISFALLDGRYVNVTGDTMTGDLTLQANLVFDGTRKIIGGTGTTSDLTLQTTSGVGTTGADMHFLVGNNGATEAMTILNNGNVGIGTTDPASKLHVKAAASGSVASLDNNSSTYSWLAMKTNGTDRAYLTWDMNAAASAAGNNLQLQNYVAGGDLQLITKTAGGVNNLNQLFLQSTGNVGIGTATPDSSLHIAYKSGVNNLQWMGSSNVIGYLSYSGTNAGYFDLRSGGVAKIVLTADSTSYFNAGNVGIGTTGPTAILHLKAGTATANTAPLKFNSGTLNTTAEAGAMEFLSERFHLTPTSLARQVIPGVLFTQTADATVANTVTETTLVGTGVGTVTLPANFFVAGKTLRVVIWGYFSTTGTPNDTMSYKLGSTVVATTGAMPMGSNSSNQIWKMEMTLTCRTTGTTGTVMAQGICICLDSTSAARIMELVATTTVTINTTISQALDITNTWGTASESNTITSTNCVVEVIN